MYFDGLLRVYETGRGGPVSTFIEDPGVAAAGDDSPIVQSLMATLTGRTQGNAVPSCGLSVS